MNVKTIFAAAAVATALVSMPALAADPAPVAAPAATYSVSETDIGSLLDNPATKAVLDKNLPGFSTNPQIEMARSMTLKQIQGFAPDQMTDAQLTAIETDLKAIPAAK